MPKTLSPWRWTTGGKIVGPFIHIHQATFILKKENKIRKIWLLFLHPALVLLLEKNQEQVRAWQNDYSRWETLHLALVWMGISSHWGAEPAGCTNGPAVVYIHIPQPKSNWPKAFVLIKVIHVTLQFYYSALHPEMELLQLMLCPAHKFHLIAWLWCTFTDKSKMTNAIAFFITVPKWTHSCHSPSAAALCDN